MNIPKTGPNIGSRQDMKNDKQAYSHVPKKKSINHGAQNTGGVYKPSIIGGGFSTNSHKNTENLSPMKPQVPQTAQVPANIMQSPEVNL